MFSPSHCLPCPPGTQCHGIGLETPSICDAGYYCPFKVGQPTLFCVPGSFCPAGVDEPIACPPGKACPYDLMTTPEFDCYAGHYCIGGATKWDPVDLVSDKGGICPLGAYCPTGSAFPLKCPAGTKNPYSKKFSLDHCMQCEPGTYCDEDGLASNKGFCYPGFYCDAGSPSKYQFKCKVGHMCVNGLSTMCAGGQSYQPRP